MNQATIDFIREHSEEDVRRLALKGAADGDVDMRYALEQIAGRQAARRKLPSWAAVEGLEYPPHLSMEQCSGERAARYKAEVAKRIVGENTGRVGSTESTESTGMERRNSDNVSGEYCGCRLVDLTGGFGVDFSFMARAFDEAVYVERQERLCDIARRNMPLLGLEDVEVVCGETEDFLKGMSDVQKTPISSTLIYLDPARRDDAGGRTFAISDCTPDVVLLRDELLRKADFVMVKLSPMLDWRKAVSDLGDKVGEVHIVAVDNECKDLLIVMSERYSGLERIYCINNESKVVISPKQLDCSNKNADVGMRDAALDALKANVCVMNTGVSLYEPNAAIMKAGCFGAIEDSFGVCQVERNSHLFLCDRLVEDFPGRRFQIEKRLTMNKKELKTGLAGIKKANVAVRNFPLSVVELRKRLKLADGGDAYIFATTERDGSHVLYVCRKV